MRVYGWEEESLLSRSNTPMDSTILLFHIKFNWPLQNENRLMYAHSKKQREVWWTLTHAECNSMHQMVIVVLKSVHLAVNSDVILRLDLLHLEIKWFHIGVAFCCIWQSTKTHVVAFFWQSSWCPIVVAKSPVHLCDCFISLSRAITHAKSYQKATCLHNAKKSLVAFCRGLISTVLYSLCIWQGTHM